MNIGGGEAADQLVRMMLSGTEVAVRLSGSALKNVLALTMALAKNNKTISGKVNLGRMLRETRDLRQFPLTPEQYRQFAKLAKKQKILFSAIRDKDGQGKIVDVILPATELDRANMIFERVLHPAPERQSPRMEKVRQGLTHLRNGFAHVRNLLPERLIPQRKKEKEEKEKTKGDSAIVRAMRDLLDNQQGRDGDGPRESPEPIPPPPQERSAEDPDRQEVVPPKKDSRSARDSPDTRPSSSTPREAGDARTTSDRPSIEERLKAYRAQLDQRRASAPSRAKAKGKTKPKSR